MHGRSCTIRIIGIRCIGRGGTNKIGSTTSMCKNNVQHRTSTTVIGSFVATKAVTRAAVRGTAAVVVQLTSIDAETDTGAMMWAKLMVAIIVLLVKLQTGVGGSPTPRMSRTATIGIPRGRQCDHRVCNMRLTTTVMQSS